MLTDARKRTPHSASFNQSLGYSHHTNAVTTELDIYRLVVDACEEHYLLADNECGLSLIDDPASVSRVEGTEDCFILRFRMPCGRLFDVKKLACLISHRLNCLRRVAIKECSVSYPGVIRPMKYLECAFILEDNRMKPPIDRGDETDDWTFMTT